MTGRTRRHARRIVLSICLVLSIGVALPTLENRTLRATYFNLLAHWRAKLFAPQYVFVGDSITAGGFVWGWRVSHDPLAAVNLGESGLLTRQIADTVSRAAAYRPSAIVIMAGTNDALEALSGRPLNEVQLAATWDRIFAQANGAPVIVTLPTLSTTTSLNVYLRRVDDVARSAALRHGAAVIDLNGTFAPDGLMLPSYTLDGVHLSEDAYAVWGERLRLASERMAERATPVAQIVR